MLFPSCHYSHYLHFLPHFKIIDQTISPQFITPQIIIVCSQAPPIVDFQSTIHPLTLIHPTLLDNLPHPPIILPPILIIQPTRLRIRRTRWIRITQQTLNTRQYRRNIINRTPLILQYIQTNLSIIVNIGMEHLREETDLRGLVRVIFREFED